MNLSTLSLELQQVFALVYAALIFWALVLIVVASVGLAVFRAAHNMLRRNS